MSATLRMVVTSIIIVGSLYGLWHLGGVIHEWLEENL